MLALLVPGVLMGATAAGAAVPTPSTLLLLGVGT